MQCACLYVCRGSVEKQQEPGDWSVNTIKVAPKRGSSSWKLDHHLEPEWVGRKEIYPEVNCLLNEELM